ncbi:TPA: AAA family ATPase, partial [Candidatus Bathyarchaeota archaeon]|nr:AAA family ATPase [Candidatus Bathyarchaeota archaeon]
GPPGTGKTSSVHVLAEELGFDLLEINASDYRTRTRMEELIGRATTQNVTIFGKRRLILFDEMEGVSGHEDLGGISAISDIIKTTRVPIILIATAIAEDNEEKFRPLRDKTIAIEFKPVPTMDVYAKLERIAKELKLDAPPDALDALAVHSTGDLRSAINDLETIARGKGAVTVEDVEKLSVRDRQDYTPAIVLNIFSAKTLWEARKSINQAYIDHEELFDWIYENLPLILDDKRDLAEGLDALSRADIYAKRARISSYRLQKYMFNAMTGGVAFAGGHSEGLGLRKQVSTAVAKLGYPQSAFVYQETAQGMLVKPIKYMGDDWRRVNEALRGLGATWVRGGNGWAIPYLRPPQLKWRYIRTYHSRRKLQAVAAKVALKCHISSKEAVSEVIPLLRLMYRNKEGGEATTAWLDLEEDEVDWLKG